MQHLWPPLAFRSSLLALQVFQVVVLWVHDWMPLGELNDPAAVRNEVGHAALVRTTVLQSLPWSFGLAASVFYFHRPYPTWLSSWLWVTYLILLVGELRAWWWPYLVRSEPVRAQRYHRMFGQTHAFLPPHNGLVPNTLHVLLHLSTLLTVALLAILHFSG